MSDVLTIARKELRAYFYSPVAYVVLVIFLLLCGWLFFSAFFLVNEASMRSFFDLQPLLLVVFAPAVTMRLMAEERKSGTIELLTTMPLSDWSIIGGKFLAAVVLFCCGLACTLPYALSIATVGVIDFGPVLSGYLGTFFLVLALCAIGLLASTWCDNQISSMITALALGLALYFIGPFAFFLPEKVAAVANYLSLGNHFDSFTKGVISLRDTVYYLSIAGLALYLAIFSLGNRRVK